jgi:transposase
MTWSSSAPGSPRRSAGTCTNSTPTCPDVVVPSRGLRRHPVVAELATELNQDRFDGVVAGLARTLLARCDELNHQINALEAERFADRAADRRWEGRPSCVTWSRRSPQRCWRSPPAARCPRRDHRRDRRRAPLRDNHTYARFTGTAPVPVWSGASAGKVRSNRGGNRTVNCAPHIIAVTQARGIDPGQAYLAKQQARGKDKTAAPQLPRRRLSDTVFTALRADQQHESQATPLVAMAARPASRLT